MFDERRSDLSCVEAKKAALVEYTRKEYKLEEKANLKLIEDKLANTSCYRELIFEGESSLKAWQLKLYLSPDQRFLTGELLDTSLDPTEEDRKRAAALMDGLMSNKGSSKGRDDAPVTIVEFSDFECPFCARFAGIFGQLSSTEKDGVRLVFHHFPLSTHPWARIAAEGAACAQLQNSESFWTIHDELFRHQQEITRENLKEKLIGYAQASNALDLKSFQACMDNELSLGLVFRDMNLASADNVQATPTLFINGHRVPGVRDANQLRQLIAEAKKEGTQSHASTNPVVQR